MEEWETVYTEETIDRLKRKYRRWDTACSVAVAVLAGSLGIIHRLLPDGWDAISFVNKNGVFHFIGRLNQGFWVWCIFVLLLAVMGLLNLFFRKRYPKAYEEFTIARTGGNIRKNKWLSRIGWTAVVVVVVIVTITLATGNSILTHITLSDNIVTVSGREHNKNFELTYQIEDLSDIRVREYAHGTELGLFLLDGTNMYVTLSKTNEAVHALLREWDSKTGQRYHLVEQMQKELERKITKKAAA